MPLQTTLHSTTPKFVGLLMVTSTLVLLVVQWYSSQMTGSALIFGQAIIQLALTVFLLSLWLQPPPRWLVALQFFSSVMVILLCGLLINESYIFWQEGRAVLTAQALPVVLLGGGGPLLLSRLFIRIAGESYPNLGRIFAGHVLPFTAIALVGAMLLAHQFGWLWLDALAALCSASFMGLVALFFLLDSYWNIMETKNQA